MAAAVIVHPDGFDAADAAQVVRGPVVAGNAAIAAVVSASQVLPV